MIVILDMEPNPMRAHRPYRPANGVAIAGTDVNEMLWAAKEPRSKEEQRHR